MQIDLDIAKTMRSGKKEFHLEVRLRSANRRIVLLGPSGSGKSLTLSAIAGLLTPDSGHIRSDGVTLFDQKAGINLAPQTRHVGYLFQNYALFPHLNVRQNIGFGLTRSWQNLHTHQQNAAVDHWLEACRLTDVAHQRPSELSGGQQQRTALARALILHPRLLLLDEPFTALDPDLRATMRDELDQLQRRLGIPMILVTHDAEDVRVFGDHVLRLREGRVDEGGLSIG